MLYLISAPNVIEAEKLAKQHNVNQYRFIPVHNDGIRVRILKDCPKIYPDNLIGPFSSEERAYLTKKVDPKNSIILDIDGIPILTVTMEGIFYKGDLVKDAGEMYERLGEFLTAWERGKKKVVAEDTVEMKDEVTVRKVVGDDKEEVSVKRKPLRRRLKGDSQDEKEEEAEENDGNGDSTPEEPEGFRDGDGEDTVPERNLSEDGETPASRELLREGGESVG